MGQIHCRDANDVAGATPRSGDEEERSSKRKAAPPTLRIPERPPGARSPETSLGFGEPRSGSMMDTNGDRKVAAIMWAAVMEMRKISGVLQNIQRIQAVQLRAQAMITPPLVFAASEGDAETVQFLVEKIRLPAGTKAMSVAAEKGHLNVVRWLALQGKADVNLPDERGETPLMVAARGGNADIVRFLLDETEAYTFGNKAGFTPLHYALSCEDDRKGLEVLKALVERKADVEKRLEDGNTLLLHAVSEGGLVSLRTIKYLVREAKASVNATNTITGQTTLMLVSGANEHLAPDLKLVRWLVEEGKANINIEDNLGMTAYAHSREEGHDDIADWLEDIVHGPNEELDDSKEFF